ncbi:MAG: hypothetical protein KDC44_09785 [Phaeodactylibacter sp.]|nr:hypothetical protein [Phaeodactylibacter sp.]
MRIVLKKAWPTLLCFPLLLGAFHAKAHYLMDDPPIGGFGWSFSDLFDESDYFSPGGNFLWADYQVASNRGKRPDQIRTIVPMVGLNYERQHWLGLGLRASGSYHWWQEDKILVRSGTVGFKELFDYKYWTAALGPTWHFTTDSPWDPYVGGLISFRRVTATCDCQESAVNQTIFDLLMGTRYFMGESFFGLFEVGHSGTGYLKFGLGFKF